MMLSDVMTRDLPKLDPDDSVQDAARRMADRGVAALPVCRDGHLVGIVTDWDVTLAAAASSDLGEVPVEDAMTPEVVSADLNTPLHEAAEILGGCRCHHLCVTEQERFCGMVHLEVDWMHLGADAHAPMATFSAPL